VDGSEVSGVGVVPVSHAQPSTAVGSGGALQTYHGCAADCLQRALRFSFRQRLKPSVMCYVEALQVTNCCLNPSA